MALIQEVDVSVEVSAGAAAPEPEPEQTLADGPGPKMVRHCSSISLINFSLHFYVSLAFSVAFLSHFSRISLRFI